MEGLRKPRGARRAGRGVATSGFSLIEVMVALGILAFGILAATASQIASMRVASESRNRSVAMNLSEEMIEIFEFISADDVLLFLADPGYPNDPANPIDPDPGDGATMQFNRVWIIEPDTPEQGVITLTVTVSWEDAMGVTRSAQIQALKVDS